MYKSFSKNSRGKRSLENENDRIVNGYSTENVPWLASLVSILGKQVRKVLGTKWKTSICFIKEKDLTVLSWHNLTLMQPLDTQNGLSTTPEIVLRILALQKTNIGRKIIRAKATN